MFSSTGVKRIVWCTRNISPPPAPLPRSRKERAFLRWDQQPEDYEDSGCKFSGSGATTRPLLPADQRQTPLTGCPCVGPSAGFLLSDQPKPASLIRTLLLRAGVEPNLWVLAIFHELIWKERQMMSISVHPSYRAHSRISDGPGGYLAH